MSEIQVCEGIWWNRWRQRLVITRCEPRDGQQWTDGAEYYSDDGTYNALRGKTGRDLVEHLGPLPQQDQTAEIDRLRAEWRSEFNAAQQLRSEVAQLEQLLDDARDNLRDLEAAARAFDHHCEGMKAAYLAVIKTLVEARS